MSIITLSISHESVQWLLNGTDVTPFSPTVFTLSAKISLEWSRRVEADVLEVFDDRCKVCASVSLRLGEFA